MATIGRQYKPKRTFINGVDNTTPIESPDIANTLSVGLNCEMVDSDILKTRPGFTGVTVTKANYRIREGIEYTKSDGTRENIVYLESTTPTGSTGILGKVVGTSIVDITTGLPDGIKPSLVQAGPLLFIFTGISDRVYDGTTTRQIGIDAPASAPQLNSTIPGSLNDGGFYVYTYVYRNSITGAISSPSLPSPTITAGNATDNTNGIRIAITPGDSATSDSIDVYRTASAGTVYYYDGTTTIGATTYDSTIEDAGLGNQLEEDNSRLPEAAKFAVLVDNRLFVGGFPSNPNRVQYSKIGINGSMYESFQVSDFIDCNSNSRDIIVGLGKLGTKVGIVKNTKVGKLVPIDISVGGLETGGSQKYIYKELNDTCTSTNHHTIFPVGDAMGWLGRDNVYITDGFEIKPIANRIRNTIRTLNHNLAYKYSSEILTTNHQLILSVIRSGQTEPDYQLVGHFKDFPIIGWTMFGPGLDPTTHPGIPAASLWTTLVNGQEVIYFGTSSTNGRVHQYGLGNNDGGSPIYFLVKDQWEPGPDGIGKKSFHSVKCLVTTGAASPNNTLMNTWEENGKEYVVKSESKTVVTSTKWNTAKWNTFKWAGVEYSLISFYPNRKALLGRFGLYNSTIDSPMAIKSIRMIYSLISE